MGPSPAGQAPRRTPIGALSAALGNRAVFIVSLVVVEVVAAYFVVTALIEPRVAGLPTAVAADARTAAGGVGPMLLVDDVVVNLTASSGARYLATSVAVELERSSRGASRGAVSSRVPLVKDVIIHTLSAKSDADVRTMAGRERVREELRREVGKALSPIAVRAVYFTEFVVQ